MLLAPSKSALERMLTVAYACAGNLSLRFNCAKSQYLIFSRNSQQHERSVRFNGVDVHAVTEGKHLGRVLSSTDSTLPLENGARDLVTRFNTLMSRFHHCSPEVKYHLFKTYCTTAYGSQLWDFSNKTFQQYHVSWRKCIRKLWNLPATTHCHLLPGVCNDYDIEFQLLQRQLNFFRTYFNSSNSLIAIAAKLCISGTFSPVSNSLAYIREKFHVTNLFLSMKLGSLSFPQNPSDTSISIREFCLYHYSASYDDKPLLKEIINYLCIS